MLLVGILHVVRGQNGTQAKALRVKLFDTDGYDKKIRPANDQTDPTGMQNKDLMSRKVVKMYFWICALSEDSDQPAHSRSLIRLFTVRSLNSQECSVFMRKTETQISPHGSPG